MEMRVFGRTGLQLSVLGFGCGAVGGLMVRGDPLDQERAVARAIAVGVNYFDTAAQYGNGKLEKGLGRVLQRLQPTNAVVGTKVRVPSADFGRIADAVTSRSTTASPASPRSGRHLPPAQCDHATTAARRWVSHRSSRGGAGIQEAAASGQNPFSRTHRDRRHAALSSGVDARAFDSAQVVCNMLNPSAATALPANYPAQDHGRLFDHSRSAGAGVIGIRVLAGGALSGSVAVTRLPFRRLTPIGSAMSYEADIARARRLMPWSRKGLPQA